MTQEEQKEEKGGEARGKNMILILMHNIFNIGIQINVDQTFKDKDSLLLSVKHLKCLCVCETESVKCVQCSGP